MTGHTLLIYKALYGLRSSGLCWHQRFAEVLHVMGFVQSKAESDIWLRENNGLYEYIAVYVDDLLIASRDSGEITRALQESHKLKLKVLVHLRTIWVVTTSKTRMESFVMVPEKYIGKIMDQYENMFGFKPKEYTSPLEKGDHPEIDTTDELDDSGVKKYQTMIGCLQWAVSLGRFDIQTATMTMS
jgi:Reverse transcriptase (RNA-dependent DNA polymerase)